MLTTHRAGADDDHPGPGAVLCRHGPQEERARHHDAELRHLRAGDGALDGGRLQPRLRRGRPPISATSPSCSCCAAWPRTGTSPSRWAAATRRWPSTIPETVFMMFQMTFAIITAGADHRRLRRPHEVLGLCCSSSLWSLLVYAPVAHWVWHPNGWIFALGALDFAGGTVVHINAGVAGLVAALVLGKRRRLRPRQHVALQPGLRRDRRRRCCGWAGSASTPARPVGGRRRARAWRCW